MLYRYSKVDQSSQHLDLGVDCRLPDGLMFHKLRESFDLVHRMSRLILVNKNMTDKKWVNFWSLAYSFHDNEIWVRRNLGPVFVSALIVSFFSERVPSWLVVVLYFAAIILFVRISADAKRLCQCDLNHWNIPGLKTIGAYLMCFSERKHLEMIERFRKVTSISLANSGSLHGLMHYCHLGMAGLEHGALDCRGVSGLVVLSLLCRYFEESKTGAVSSIDPLSVELVVVTSQHAVLAGHYYVVYGRDERSINHDIKTWGDGCVIIDPWHGVIVSIGEIELDPGFLQKYPLLRPDNKDFVRLSNGNIEGLRSLACGFGRIAKKNMPFENQSGFFLRGSVPEGLHAADELGQPVTQIMS